MRLSIIVPVYNVENYIRPCMESIFRQGLYESDYEVVVVNDGTRDRSMDIVAELAATHANIRIVEQRNQGLSAARNTGLDNAQGQYILFLDSDDLLIDGTLATLLQEAEKAEADMAVAGFVKMDDAAIDALDTPSQRGEVIHGSLTARDGGTSDAPKSMLTTGQELFLSDAFNPRECYVWRTLYRHSFLSEGGLRFVPGIYFEDVPFTTRCYLKAERCLQIGLTFYIYRQRSNSIVSSLNMQKLFDLNTVVALLSEMRGELCTSVPLRCRMDDTIFATFSIAVWYITHDKALLDKRREFIEDLRGKLPGLHCSHGLKQRLVSAVYNAMPNAFIWLRATI